MDSSILAEYNAKKINLKISKKDNMNVFIYGGRSRTEAHEMVIDGNQQATEG